MTLYDSEMVKCALCGKESEQTVLLSSSRYGASDLDLRPAPNERDTMIAWIMDCEHCGYCAYDISKEKLNAEKIVKSANYRKILEWGKEFGLAKNNFRPTLASKFICCAMILEESIEPDIVGWTYLRAAWAFDDGCIGNGVTSSESFISMDAVNGERRKNASKCRMDAIAKFEECLKAGKKFVEQEGAEQLVLADLYRRCGQFEKAVEIANSGMKKGDKDVAEILKSEIKFAKAHDTACHRIGE